MKKMHKKNRLYMIPGLLFCIGLQGTDAKTIPSNSTQANALQANTDVSSDTDNHVNPQALDAYDVAITRVHNRPNRPKPNTAASQNTAVSYSMQNMPTSQQHNNQYYHNQAQLSDSQAQNYSNLTQYGGINQNQYDNGNQPSYNNDNMQQNSAGSFDTNFKSHNTTGSITTGYVINEMGFKSAPRAVTVQKDNKIVVAGIRDEYPVLVRYNNNGELDKDFGGVGTYGPGVTIQTSLGKGSFFNAVAIDTQCDCNQKIVVAGSAAGKGILARYYHDGTLDTAFGDKGIVRTNIAGELNAIAVKADGTVVAAGVNTVTTSNTHLIVMQFDKQGNFDNNFGTRGVVLTQIGAPSRANTIAIQEDNKIVVAGTVNSGNRTDMIIVRYNTDGTLDQSFGLNNSGMSIFNIENKNNVAYDVAIQKNGAILVTGSSMSENNKSLFSVIRLQQNGSLDTSFGTNGIITATPTNNPTHNAYARSIVLDKNDNIIVMGYVIEGGYNYFSLIRYNSNGALDTAFGNREGSQSSILKLTPTSLNQAEIPVVGTIQNNKEKLVLAGMYSGKHSTTASLIAVARYLNN